MTDIVFVDTETTGLDTTIDDIWEIAAIRVRPDGDETVLHRQIGHDIRRAQALPESFRTDHDTRFDGTTALPQRRAAQEIAAFFATDEDLQPPHFAGINPAFDAAMITRLFRRNGIDSVPWHYQLLDVRAAALGYQAAKYGDGRAAQEVDLAIRTDDLAAITSVPDPSHTRHTALGDALFARDWWFDLVGNGRPRSLEVVR